MKIKVKDEMDKIILKVSHQELLIINTALEKFKINEVDISDLNNKSFDKFEFKNFLKLNKVYLKINKKINEVLTKIHVW
jgi:hypothetical protein